MAQKVLERMGEQLAPEKGAKVSTYKRTMGIIGATAFASAFILSVVSGFVAPNNPGVILSLVVLGLVVSLLNIAAKEVTPILIASVALIVGANANVFSPLNTLVSGMGTSFNSIITYFATFMIPVAVITAIRAVIALARPGEMRA
ncbi:MAG: hypothetical protein HY665_05610 [Chloroflexi bacterium]|nr:hypothetical protein [Chloroflexota bacterium]